MMSAAENIDTPLDRPLTITFFPNFGAREKREETLSLSALAPRIRSTTGPTKDGLPWLKLARFGGNRTKKGSLRNDKNVVAISGVEGDYDNEIMTVEEAAEVLRNANIAAMVYTSPSHTDDTPRWRVLCPLSADADPSIRWNLLARLNGVFQGALSGESFTLSQSYYFGSVKKNPSHQAVLVDGAYIDQRPDLDEGAVGKPKFEYTQRSEPETPREKNNNPFIEAVIDRALSRVRNAAEGQKHHVLRAQARVLGGYQHVGKYSTKEAIDMLVRALPNTVKDKDAAAATAAWGFEKGASEPLHIPERPQSAPPAPPPDDPGYDLDNVVMMREYEPDWTPPRALLDPPPTQLIPIIRFPDIEAQIDTIDLVEDLLGTTAMSVVYGQSNSGKTFFAADLALHIAAGWEWCGKGVERMGVIYCALEGSRGIRNRIAAFKAEYGVENGVPFGLVLVPISMMQQESAEALAAAIAAEAEAIGIPIGLVVMDTLSRAMAGGNENAPDDMGLLVSHGDLIRRLTGAHLMWIHHSGKNEALGARGHSSLRAATDTEIEVSNDEGHRCAKVTKQREYECSGEFPFTLKVIELGQNQRGKTVTSCVVQHGDGEVGSAPGGVARKLKGKHERRALEVLVNVVAASGRTGDQGVPSGYSSVPEKWWRDRFYDSAMAGADDEAKRKAFRRAADGLLEAKAVGMAAGRVWVV